MTHAAKILADSISPDGVRLTTFEVTMPRIVLAEFNTHRMFSRNSASSRAIPVKKMLERVMEDPYVPSSWGKNQRGMQAGEELDAIQQESCAADWLEARDNAVNSVKLLLQAGLHKQLTNRLLEPWMWHTVIVTATEWSNFFNLRDNEMAHPDIQIPAHLMWEAAEKSEPQLVRHGGWHLPLIFDEDWGLMRTRLGCHGIDPPELLQSMVKISCARCARVSYLTHDGKRDLQKDLELYDNLLQPGHMSPFEHAARPMTQDEQEVWMADGHTADLRETWCGNFRGWVQHRKEIPGEADILAHRKGAV